MRIFWLLLAIAWVGTAAAAPPSTAIDAAEAFRRNGQAIARIERVVYDVRLNMTSYRDLDTTPTVLETLEVGTVVQCGKLHASERLSATKNTTTGKLISSRKIVELVNDREVVRVRYNAPPLQPVETKPSFVEFQAQGLPIPAGRSVRRMTDQGWSFHRLPFEIQGKPLSRLLDDPRFRFEMAPTAEGKPVIVRAHDTASGRLLYEVTLDPAKGWLMTNVTEFDEEGNVASDLTNTVVEMVPGVWFPTGSTAVSYLTVGVRHEERSRAELAISKIEVPRACEDAQFALERLKLPPDQAVSAMTAEGTWETTTAGKLHPPTAAKAGT